MLNLFVRDGASGEKLPANIVPATDADLRATKDWQTKWTSKAAREWTNKFALRLDDGDELLGLMSYEIDARGLAVELVYAESASHSNANLLRTTGQKKRYVGIGRALFAYAVSVSLQNGFDGVVTLRAKTSELVEYYRKAFGARQVGSYDPFRMVIWEDAAARIISIYQEAHDE